MEQSLTAERAQEVLSAVNPMQNLTAATIVESNNLQIKGGVNNG
jgi:hypothetical protein